MWRLLLSKRKLSPQSFKKLENIIEDMSYTCGATFEDITMPEGLESVCIKVHNCYDPIEKLYYSCGFVAKLRSRYMQKITLSVYIVPLGLLLNNTKRIL